MAIGSDGSIVNSHAPVTLRLILNGPEGRRTVPLHLPASSPASSTPAVAATVMLGASPLAWTSAGVLILQHSNARGADNTNALLLIDPETGRYRKIGVSVGVSGGRAIPIAVSTSAY